MPSAAPNLYASSSTSSSPRILRSPSYADFVLRARCWLGQDVTSAKRQLPPNYDALTLQLDSAGTGGQYTEENGKRFEEHTLLTSSSLVLLLCMLDVQSCSVCGWEL